MRYVNTVDSPVGALTMAADDSGQKLVGLWLEGQKYFGAGLSGDEQESQTSPVFELVEDWLAEYFKGNRPSPASLPLAPQGTEFQQQVWKILLHIPSGSVVTYGEIAAQVAQQNGLPSMSSQAVGGAVGRNPISIVIPCHRVVGADGSLTGYAGGLEVKRKLLVIEGGAAATLI